MAKPYNKRIEQHLFSYKKRKVLEDDFIEFYDCTLLVSTDIFDQGSNFELIQIDYSTMKALMWVKNSGEDKDFFEYGISIWLV